MSQPYSNSRYSNYGAARPVKPGANTSTGPRRQGYVAIGSVGAHKVSVPKPKPVTIPSLRSETGGNDPSVNLVGKGWGDGDAEDEEYAPQVTSKPKVEEPKPEPAKPSGVTPWTTTGTTVVSLVPETKKQATKVKEFPSLSEASTTGASSKKSGSTWADIADEDGDEEPVNTSFYTTSSMPVQSAPIARERDVPPPSRTQMEAGGSVLPPFPSMMHRTSNVARPKQQAFSEGPILLRRDDPSGPKFMQAQSATVVSAPPEKPARSGGMTVSQPVPVPEQHNVLDDDVAWKKDPAVMEEERKATADADAEAKHKEQELLRLHSEAKARREEEEKKLREGEEAEKERRKIEKLEENKRRIEEQEMRARMLQQARTIALDQAPQLAPEFTAVSVPQNVLEHCQTPLIHPLAPPAAPNVPVSGTPAPVFHLVETKPIRQFLDDDKRRVHRQVTSRPHTGFVSYNPHTEAPRVQRRVQQKPKMKVYPMGELNTEAQEEEKSETKDQDESPERPKLHDDNKFAALEKEDPDWETDSEEDHVRAPPASVPTGETLQELENAIISTTEDMSGETWVEVSKKHKKTDSSKHVISTKPSRKFATKPAPRPVVAPAPAVTPTPATPQPPKPTETTPVVAPLSSEVDPNKSYADALAGKKVIPESPPKPEKPLRTKKTPTPSPARKPKTTMQPWTPPRLAEEEDRGLVESLDSAFAKTDEPTSAPVAKEDDQRLDLLEISGEVEESNEMSEFMHDLGMDDVAEPKKDEQQDSHHLDTQQHRQYSEPPRQIPQYQRPQTTPESDVRRPNWDKPNDNIWGTGLFSTGVDMSGRQAFVAMSRPGLNPGAPSFNYQPFMVPQPMAYSPPMPYTPWQPFMFPAPQSSEMLIMQQRAFIYMQQQNAQLARQYQDMQQQQQQQSPDFMRPQPQPHMQPAPPQQQAAPHLAGRVYQRSPQDSSSSSPELGGPRPRTTPPTAAKNFETWSPSPK